MKEIGLRIWSVNGNAEIDIFMLLLGPMTKHFYFFLGAAATQRMGEGWLEGEKDLHHKSEEAKFLRNVPTAVHKENISKLLRNIFRTKSHPRQSVTRRKES